MSRVGADPGTNGIAGRDALRTYVTGALQRTPGIRYGDPYPPGGDIEVGDPHNQVFVLDATSTLQHQELNLPSGTSVNNANGVVDFVDGRYALLLDSDPHQRNDLFIITRPRKDAGDLA